LSGISAFSLNPLTGHLGRILFFYEEESSGLAEIWISGFFGWSA